MAYFCQPCISIVGPKTIVNDLLAKHGSIFFSFCNEIFGIAAHFILHDILSHFFSLLVSNIAYHWFSIRIIVLWYFMSGLLKDPVVLVIVVVTSLIHEILEYLSHVIVVRSLLKFEIPAVLEIGIEFLWNPPCERFDGC